MSHIRLSYYTSYVILYLHFFFSYFFYLFFFFFFFLVIFFFFFFFFSSRRRHTRSLRDWSSDVCSSDLWRFRQELTVELASAFLTAHRQRGCRFEPVAVAHGWSPNSYAEAVRQLRSEERRVGKECRSRWSRNH